MSAAVIQWVDVDLVEEPLHLLRTVDTESPKYQGLLESMRRDGFWPSRPIEVTEDKSGASTVYVISSEGMHRLTAARTLNIAQVPIVVLDKPLNDVERFERAIIAEVSHVEARPVEFGRALSKLLEHDEYKGLTDVDLGRKLHQTPAWVRARLNVAKLPDGIGELVNDGSIKLGNALTLVTLLREGVELSDAVITKAKQEQAPAFASEAQKLIGERKKSPKIRKEPAPKMRPMADVIAEYSRAKKDPHAPPGALRSLAWVLRQDAVSAAVDGSAGPLLGTPEEAPALRAHVVVLEEQIGVKNLLLESASEELNKLRKQLEILEDEVTMKDAIIEEFKKGRKAKK